ncbi:MAG: ABC transporter permease [Spirochaetes bacterium]|nr:ABC transporter permease [Spirochaetota bacterium]
MADRALSVEKPWSLKQFLFQWEWLLALIFILVMAANSFISPFFLNASTLLHAPRNFLDRGFIVFPMMMVILLGRIDISVGSNVALTSVIMGVTFNAGLPMPLAIVLALFVGTILGGITGLLQIKFFELPAMIVTLSTMILYRGIAFMILENMAAGGFPDWFLFFSWGYVGRIPFILLAFAAAAVIFGIVIHKTAFGRTIYAMGNNFLACKYSGIKTDRVLLKVSLLTGLMCAVCAIFLTSRMGSTRPNVAINYELDVIAMVVLGGVSTAGGTGKIAGPILAIFIIGFLNFGLGLMNISAQVNLIILGLMLILSVLVMNLRSGKPKV